AGTKLAHFAVERAVLVQHAGREEFLAGERIERRLVEAGEQHRRSADRNALRPRAREAMPAADDVGDDVRLVRAAIAVGEREEAFELLRHALDAVGVERAEQEAFIARAEPR